jgi:hypothetical protein
MFYPRQLKRAQQGRTRESEKGSASQRRAETDTEGESRLSELDSDQTRQGITAKATETEAERKKTSLVLPRAHDDTLLGLLE